MQMNAVDLTKLTITIEENKGGFRLVITGDDSELLERGCNTLANAGIGGKNSFPVLIRGMVKPHYRVQTNEKELTRGLRAIANLELYALRSIVGEPFKRNARLEKTKAFCAELDARVLEIRATFTAPTDEAEEETEETVELEPEVEKFVDKGDVVNVSTDFLCNIHYLASTMRQRGLEIE